MEIPEHSHVGTSDNCIISGRPGLQITRFRWCRPWIHPESGRQPAEVERRRTPQTNGVSADGSSRVAAALADGHAAAGRLGLGSEQAAATRGSANGAAHGHEGRDHRAEEHSELHRFCLDEVWVIEGKRNEAWPEWWN